MDANIINPFINATVNVLKTMARIDPKVGAPRAKIGPHTWGVVTGIIGMTSKEIGGYLMVSFDEKSILEIVSKMLMEPFAEITEEVVDAVGELTNMIAGGTKNELNQFGYTFEMATPLMMRGQGVELKQLSNEPTIVVPFNTEQGGFVVEASMKQHREKRIP